MILMVKVVLAGEAGPSSGVRMRRNTEDRPADIAALYARIRAVEEEQARTRSDLNEQIKELGQEVERNGSYSKSAETFFTQKMAEVDVKTQEQITELNDGLRSTRGRVDEMAERMADISFAMQGVTRSSENTNQVMEGLVSRLEKLPTLISNEVDTWASIRFGSIVGDPAAVQTSHFRPTGWLASYNTAGPSTGPPLQPLNPLPPTSSQGLSTDASSQPSSSIGRKLMKEMWKELVESGSDSGGDPNVEAIFGVIGRNTPPSNARPSTPSQISVNPTDIHDMEIDIRVDDTHHRALSPLPEEDEHMENIQETESALPQSSPPPPPIIIPPTPGGSELQQASQVSSVAIEDEPLTAADLVGIPIFPLVPATSSSDSNLLHPGLENRPGPITRARTRSQTPQPIPDIRARSYTPQPVTDRQTRPQTRARSSSVTMKGSRKPRSKRG